MAFFKQGYEGQEAALARGASAEQDGKPWRFWLAQGKETTVTFLDDHPPVISEHWVRSAVHKGGDTYTCLSVLNQPCPLCAAGDRAYVAGYYHIHDGVAWKDKEGKDQAGRVKIMCAKAKSFKVIKKYSERFKGLTGMAFDVERSPERTSAAIGDMYIPLQKLTAQEIDALLGVPLASVVPQSMADREAFWEAYLLPQSAATLQAVADRLASAPPEPAMAGAGAVDYDS